MKERKFSKPLLFFIPGAAVISLSALIFSACSLFGPSDDSGKTDDNKPHTHSLTYVAAKDAASCLDSGNIEHWYCSGCEKYFADADAESEIDADDLLLFADHSFTHISAKAETCKADGNMDYFACETCGRLFSDSEGRNEMTADSVVLPKDANKHKWVDNVCTECQTDAGGSKGLFWEYEYAFNLNGTTLKDGYILKGPGTFQGGELEIPSTYNNRPVVAIANAAFYYNDSITGLVISDGLTHIGQSAFGHCTNLQAVSLGDGLEYIGAWAFEDCDAIEKVNVTSLAAWCAISFQYDTSANPKYAPNSRLYIDGELVSGDLAVPDTLSSIPAFTFMNNPITSVVIPKATVGSGAFAGCTSLSKIELPSMTTLRSLFVSATHSEDPVWVKEVIMTDHYEVAAGAFKGCSGLEKVTVPDRITNIGASAFEGCSSLQSISIPTGVLRIGAYAFKGCASLGSVTLPDGLWSIADGTFADCTNLEIVYWNAKKCEAGTDTPSFSGCTNLSTIVFGARIEEIPSYILYNCTSLENVEFEKATFGDSLLNTTKKIGGFAFFGCTNLTQIELPARLEQIYSGVFQNTGLKSIVIPDTVTYLASSAFAGCSSLESVQLSTSLEILYDNTFEGCVKLDNVVVPEGVTDIRTEVFLNCTGLHDISLPEGLLRIGNNAFKGCTELRSIDLPESTFSLGSSAFYGCTALRSITLHEGVATLGAGAFAGCTNLETVYFNAINCEDGSKSDPVFGNCTSFTTLILGEEVVSISIYMFYGCSAIRSVVIPASVISISYGAFEGCTGLNSVEFEEPAGWQCNYTSLPAAALSDTATAAKYLTDDYCGYSWRRYS